MIYRGVVRAAVFGMGMIACGSDDGSSVSNTDGAGGGTGGSGSGSGGGAAASGSGGTAASGGGGGVVIDAGDLDASAPPTSVQLTGTLRDFQESHPDFEGAIADDRGLVELLLGADGKPVYAGGAGTVTTTGAASFDQWFQDVPGVNQSMPFSITLERQNSNVYTYDNQEFFPADGQMFGNEGRDHNFHFTYEIRTEFKYLGGEIFRFTGDDDLFVFINQRLAIDLGGVHGAESDEADLDELAEVLEIEVGNEYTLDFFFAERHTSQSTFRIDTTIGTFTQVH